MKKDSKFTVSNFEFLFHSWQFAEHNVNTILFLMSPTTLYSRIGASSKNVLKLQVEDVCIVLEKFGMCNDIVVAVAEAIEAADQASEELICVDMLKYCNSI